MKIIACVVDDSMVPVLKRQIRAPEEILVAEGEGSYISRMLSTVFNYWSNLSSKERDVCFLLVGGCSLRKDALDYLRKTYVPNRIATFSPENPFMMRGMHVKRIDPSGCVLLPSKFMRLNEGRKDELLDWIWRCEGSKGIALGYWCAKQNIPAVYIGSTEVYCTPNTSVDMTEVDKAGDYISNMESDL